MELITPRTLIREVAQRWREQYPRHRHGCGSDKDEIAKKLAALDVERATAAEVEAIIGNNSWTTVPECDECGQQRAMVVQVGQEPDYESATARICVPCLKAALKLAKDAQ